MVPFRSFRKATENLGNLPSLPNYLPLKQGDVTSPAQCSIAMLNCVEVRVTPNMFQVYSGWNKRTIGYDVVRPRLRKSVPSNLAILLIFDSYIAFSNVDKCECLESCIYIYTDACVCVIEERGEEKKKRALLNHTKRQSSDNSHTNTPRN